MAVPGSLATTSGISVDFFSFGYLDVSVPQVRLFKLCIHLKMTILYSRVAPFGNRWLLRLLSAHQRLSQIVTSFIASDCLGIHRVRLFT